VFALVVLGATLGGFVLTSAFGANPAWAAGAGAVVLAGRALLRRTTDAVTVVRAADPLFLVFVLALAVVVRAVVDNGLTDGLSTVLPDGTGLAALLGIAALAAVAANVINNLPAVLVFVPLAAPAGPAALLAVLLGVNLGPNLTYAGSLATLLWRRVVHQHDVDVDLAEFTRLGLLAVPVTLVLAVLGLWASYSVIGG
jgi:arsenical pump membrane protein